jgi:hypothetical protein
VSTASFGGVPVAESHSSAHPPSVNPDEIAEPPPFAATEEERHEAIIAVEEKGGAGGETSDGSSDFLGFLRMGKFVGGELKNSVTITVGV